MFTENDCREFEEDYLTGYKFAHNDEFEFLQKYGLSIEPYDIYRVDENDKDTMHTEKDEHTWDDVEHAKKLLDDLAREIGKYLVIPSKLTDDMLSHIEFVGSLVFDINEDFSYDMQVSDYNHAIDELSYEFEYKRVELETQLEYYNYIQNLKNQGKDE
ncbi:MAG: hypothetical protein K2N51_16975 [Lachnospiraceae bacterium]|nr:hypothetical protein [Lachnospiraceae bacterium]